MGAYVTPQGLLKVREITLGRVLPDGRLEIKRKNNKRIATNIGPYEIVSLDELGTAVSAHLEKVHANEGEVVPLSDQTNKTNNSAK